MLSAAPYVGITGITAPYIADQIARMDIWKNSGRMFMNGILMSHGTMVGHEPTYHHKRYPPRDSVARLFVAEPHVMNIIHYSTKQPENLLWEMLALVGMYAPCPTDGECAGARLHGFQLNIPWPDPGVLREFRQITMDRGAEFYIIVQIGHHALEQIGNDEQALAGYLTQYEGTAEYALIDESGGTNRMMDVRKMSSYLEAIEKSGINIRTGIAGGLCHSQIHNIEPLLQVFPDISIDAEGALRNHDEEFIPHAGEMYVREALETCKRIAAAD
jgi:hypothetical protein